MISTEHYDLAVRGPIPLGILNALIPMLGAAWPNTVLVTDQKLMPAGHEGVVFRIPRTDLAAPAPDPETIRQIASTAAEAEAEGANAATIDHFDNTGIKGRLPDELSQLIASIALELFEGYPGANYLSIPVSLPPESTPGSWRRYEVTVQRAEKPTPHTMRTRAEARVAELEQQLADAHTEIDRLQAWEAVGENGPAEIEERQ